jgi:hypothetical protein
MNFTLFLVAVATFAFGVFVGGSISFRASVDREVKKRLAAGPLHDLSRSALQIERSKAALRGRAFAASVIFQRVQEIEPAEAGIEVLVELTSLQRFISVNESPVENPEATDMPTLEECRYKGKVGRQSLEELAGLK